MVMLIQLNRMLFPVNHYLKYTKTLTNKYLEIAFITILFPAVISAARITLVPRYELQLGNQSVLPQQLSQNL